MGLRCSVTVSCTVGCTVGCNGFGGSYPGPCWARRKDPCAGTRHMGVGFRQAGESRTVALGSCTDMSLHVEMGRLASTVNTMNKIVYPTQSPKWQVISLCLDRLLIQQAPNKGDGAAGFERQHDQQGPTPDTVATVPHPNTRLP